MIDLKKVVIKEKKVDTILTKSNLPIAGYSINTYVGCPFGCEYCYATFMKRFTGHKEDWGMFLDVKMWDKIKNPEKYKGKTMIVGSVTDGYNYFEVKYKRTRVFLEEMQGSGINLIITTKSNLVTRDIDLIKTYPNPLVVWSINTLDEEFKKDMDSAPTIKSRIEAMKQVHDVGIRTTCFFSVNYLKLGYNWKRTLFKIMITNNTNYMCCFLMFKIILERGLKLCQKQNIHFFYEVMYKLKMSKFLSKINF